MKEALGKQNTNLLHDFIKTIGIDTNVYDTVVKYT